MKTLRKRIESWMNADMPETEEEIEKEITAAYLLFEEVLRHFDKTNEAIETLEELKTQ